MSELTEDQANQRLIERTRIVRLLNSLAANYRTKSQQSTIEHEWKQAAIAASDLERVIEQIEAGDHHEVTP